MEVSRLTKTEAVAGEEPKPSRNVADLTPYDAVSSLDKIKENGCGLSPLKLDWNEATIPPSPKVLEAIRAFLGIEGGGLSSSRLNWYPDLSARPLRKAIEKYTGVPADQVLVTNGSDDALNLICASYLDPEDEVIVAAPTYGHFLVFARAKGARVMEVFSQDLFGPPTSALYNAIGPKTKMVYVASPNNPTGVVIPASDVEGLCASFPSTLFIVDEAYHEFCGKTCAPLLLRLKNLVVTRTFSKCFALAALRIGYLMSSPGVISHLKKLHNPKSVNAIGQVAAVAALEDEEYRETYVAEVRRSREILVEALKERGAEARTTEANFVLLRVRDPGTLIRALESVGVYVRDRSHIKGFSGYVRITVGTVAQTKELIARIDSLLERQGDLLAPP